MPNTATERAAIGAALATVTGLRGSTTGMWTEQMNLPAYQIRPAGPSEALSLDLSTWNRQYDVTVAVSQKGGLERAEAALDAFYDQVLDALRSGLAGTLLNIAPQDYGDLQLDGIELVGFTLRLEMLG